MLSAAQTDAPQFDSGKRGNEKVVNLWSGRLGPLSVTEHVVWDTVHPLSYVLPSIIPSGRCSINFSSPIYRLATQTYLGHLCDYYGMAELETESRLTQIPARWLVRPWRGCWGDLFKKFTKTVYNKLYDWSVGPAAQNDQSLEIII